MPTSIKWVRSSSAGSDLAVSERPGHVQIDPSRGRIEHGESDAECLAREIREELGEVKLAHLEYLGTYEDRASLDDPTVVKTLRLALYRARWMANRPRRPKSPNWSGSVPTPTGTS